MVSFPKTALFFVTHFRQTKSDTDILLFVFTHQCSKTLKLLYSPMKQLLHLGNQQTHSLNQPQNWAFAAVHSFKQSDTLTKKTHTHILPFSLKKEFTKSQCVPYYSCQLYSKYDTIQQIHFLVIRNSCKGAFWNKAIFLIRRENKLEKVIEPNPYCLFSVVQQ